MFGKKNRLIQESTFRINELNAAVEKLRAQKNHFKERGDYFLKESQTDIADRDEQIAYLSLDLKEAEARIQEIENELAAKKEVAEMYKASASHHSDEKAELKSKNQKNLKVIELQDKLIKEFRERDAERGADEWQSPLSTLNKLSKPSALMASSVPINPNQIESRTGRASKPLFTYSGDHDSIHAPLVTYDDSNDRLEVQMLDVSYEKIMVNEYVDLWFVQTTISVVDGPNIDAGAVAGFSLKQVNKVFKDLGLDRRKPQDVSAVMNELINENSHIDFTSYVDTIGNEIKATELMFQLCGEAQSTHISAGLNTSPASLRPSKEKV